MPGSSGEWIVLCGLLDFFLHFSNCLEMKIIWAPGLWSIVVMQFPFVFFYARELELLKAASFIV